MREFPSPADIRAMQERLLGGHLRYIAAHSPYYRGRLPAIGDGPFSLDRMGELPLTDKSAFAHHNDELLCVPMSKVEDIVLSSGTTGTPTRVMYTRADLERLAYNEHLSFASTGMGPEDIVLLTCTMDRCFIAGLAYYLGIRSIGAAAIRNGLSSLESHAGIIEQLRPTAIVGVPSFLAKLGQFMAGRDISHVRRLICIGEPVRGRDLEPSALGQRLREVWPDASVHSTYASSETITSFCECSEGRGGHLHPELAVVEIVDDAGIPVVNGELGEIVLTPLGIEGMPLVRFRTGDMSFVATEPCACGRNSVRLGPIMGRKMQMMKFKGTTVYPNAIFALLDGTAGVREYCIEVTSGDYELSDVVKVIVSVGPEFTGSAEDIRGVLQAGLRVTPTVEIATQERLHALVHAGRKPMRFIDLRRRS